MASFLLFNEYLSVSAVSLCACGIKIHVDVLTWPKFSINALFTAEFQRDMKTLFSSYAWRNALIHRETCVQEIPHVHKETAETDKYSLKNKKLATQPFHQKHENKTIEKKNKGKNKRSIPKRNPRSTRQTKLIKTKSLETQKEV